jgi:hypothetical protein
MRQKRRNLWGLCAGVSLAALAGIAIGLPLLPASGPNTDGTYQATFRGGLKGRGTVIVTPTGVTIAGNVVDQRTGRKSLFVTANLGMKHGRFRGPGMAGVNPVQLVGRVEPADGTLIKTQRVICTLTEGSTATRIVAVK